RRAQLYLSHVGRGRNWSWNQRSTHTHRFAKIPDRRYRMPCTIPSSSDYPDQRSLILRVAARGLCWRSVRRLNDHQETNEAHIAQAGRADRRLGAISSRGCEWPWATSSIHQKPAGCHRETNSDPRSTACRLEAVPFHLRPRAPGKSSTFHLVSSP